MYVSKPLKTLLRCCVIGKKDMTENIDIDQHYPNPFKYTARESAEKMVSEIEGDPGAWAEGVGRTGLDVMSLAASDDAEANFKAAMMQVLNAKLRQAGLKEVSTAEWKRICEEKSGAWASGVGAKRDKVIQKVAESIAVTYEVAEEVRGMKKGIAGSGENKTRMTSYFDKRVAAKKARGI